MGYAQLFQGVLMFPDQEAFEDALAAIEKGEEAEDHPPDRELFRKSMTGDRTLVLKAECNQSYDMWNGMMGRLLALCKRAVRGYVVAVGFQDEDNLEFEVFPAAANEFSELKTSEPVPAEDDYFPVYPGSRYDFEMRFGGDVSTLWWTVRDEAQTPRGLIYSLPLLDDDFNLNDYFGGSEYFSSGNRFYVVAVNDELNALESPPEKHYQLIADANHPVGSSSVVQYPDSEAFYIFQHLGFEDVAIPNGYYSSCLKLQVITKFPSRWPDDYKKEGKDTFSGQVSYYYFAKGVGPVKMGFPDGEIVLKEFHRDKESAPAPPRRPSQDVQDRATEYTPKVTSIKSTSPAKKPWWKFW